MRVQDWEEDDPERIFMKAVNPNDIHVLEQEPEYLISTGAEESQVVVNVQEQRPISTGAEESQVVINVQEERTEEDRTAQEIIDFYNNKQGLIKLTPIFEDQHWVERTNAGSN